MQNFYVASSMKLQNSDRRFQLAARVMFYSRRFSSLNQYIFSSPGRSLTYFVNSSCVTAFLPFTVYALTKTLSTAPLRADLSLVFLVCSVL